MSNYETKPGNGAIFKNNKKEKESHPDYNGKILDPNGKEWELSLWVKKSAAGNSYFSVAVKEPYKKDFVDSTVDHAKSKNDLLNEDDNDLPF